MAILGCSTLITACYGVPPMSYTVSGHVVDGVTGDPVEGIQIKVTERGAPTAEGEQQPQCDTISVRTTLSDEEGAFYIHFHDFEYPYDVLLEWQDIDGEENGLYDYGSTVTHPGESEDLTVELEPYSL